MTVWQQAESIGVVASPALVLGGWLLAKLRKERTGHESRADRLERIEVLLAGLPEDPVTHMPAQEGFVDEVRAFMDRTTAELSYNSGGSLKDQLRRVSQTVDDIKANLERR